MKTCTKCRTDKPDDQFHRAADRRSGLKSHCKECENGRSRKRGKRKPSSAKHNITLAEYDSLLKSQGNGCAICGRSPEENGQRLAVDHDHSCCDKKHSCGGCVRGLLCRRCNVVLGAVQDDGSLLFAMINYIG